jgi:hypothetical protein
LRNCVNAFEDNFDIVFLNRLLIFLCGAERVKVAHFVYFAGAVGWGVLLVSVSLYIATESTIIFLSNHPLEHKLATDMFFINRMLSLPLNDL